MRRLSHSDASRRCCANASGATVHHHALGRRRRITHNARWRLSRSEPSSVLSPFRGFDPFRERDPVQYRRFFASRGRKTPPVDDFSCSTQVMRWSSLIFPQFRASALFWPTTGDAQSRLLGAIFCHVKPFWRKNSAARGSWPRFAFLAPARRPSSVPLRALERKGVMGVNMDWTCKPLVEKGRENGCWRWSRTSTLPDTRTRCQHGAHAMRSIIIKS